jgi:hypothetical protein
MASNVCQALPLSSEQYPRLLQVATGSHANLQRLSPTPT